MEFGDINYFKIKKKIYLNSLITFFAVSIVAGLLSKMWSYSFLTGFIVTSIFLYKKFSLYRYYIKSIHFGDNVIIEYKNMGNVHQKKLKKNDIKISKKMAFSRLRVPYLVIKSISNDFRIEQYEVGNWNEEIMNEIIKKA